MLLQIQSRKKTIGDPVFFLFSNIFGSIQVCSAAGFHPLEVVFLPTVNSPFMQHVGTLGHVRNSRFKQDLTWKNKLFLLKQSDDHWVSS